MWKIVMKCVQIPKVRQITPYCRSLRAKKWVTLGPILKVLEVFFQATFHTKLFYCIIEYPETKIRLKEDNIKEKMSSEPSHPSNPCSLFPEFFSALFLSIFSPLFVVFPSFPFGNHLPLYLLLSSSLLQPLLLLLYQIQNLKSSLQRWGWAEVFHSKLEPLDGC